MNLRKTIYDIKSFFGIQWFLNRRLFIWIGCFMLAGFIFGLITIFNPAVTAQRIGRNLIDANVLNAIAPRANIISFIVARLFEFALSAIFIFVLCQTGITSLFAFAFISFRTCTYTINLYWIIVRLGAFGGWILFICYLIFFLSLLILLAAVTVFIMTQCATIRSYGFRRGICWRHFFSVMLVFAIVVSCIAAVEWLCFWLIFSKILWPVIFVV